MSGHDTDHAAAMRELLDRELIAASRVENKVRPVEAKAGPDHATPVLFRQSIADIASSVLKIPPERLDVRQNMARYGVDSIIVTEIMKRISDLLDLPIAPTVFFEARHLDDLADILHQRYRGQVAGHFSDAAEQVSEDRFGDVPVAEDAEPDVDRWIANFRAIAGAASNAGPTEVVPPAREHPGGNGNDMPVAIIAMEGMFADSANLSEFEKHLRDGDDCIREIPADRWDWRDVFGDPKQGEFTRVKYGGFTPDIDKFDPMFFGMSPREAELMDPQHRLFIQCVWKLIEAAGYAPKSLSGRKVGLFIGVNLQDYAHLIDRSGAIEALHLTSLGHMFCPNRLSFLLDIHGPSQVIDTACSSSLVALHRAVLSVRHEGCEMAIAGGANLLISPDMHVMYSKVGMICDDGRCKTFSRNANGYARGDGVGAVLLKPLALAERDGDTILAVIRGSAENHGGLSTSLTAPNPKAQASLIVEAHRNAGIDPRSIGTIECHGTGTSLGDPIEINGLKMAFEALYRSAGLALPDTPHCGLGSVKSNIGHAETAAGIAGVIKAVLAIRNRRLYPTLHCDDLNPMIELAGSPFFIAQQGAAWQRPVIDGQEQPRRAGVSSFGAGGSNAHVVIEEYVAPSPPPVVQHAPTLILLSAQNRERLADAAVNLQHFLDETPDAQAPDLGDIAYTLQVGRDAMAERLAIVACSVAELREALGRIVSVGDAGPGCYRGTVKRSREAPTSDALTASIRQSFADGDVRTLAEQWVSGVPIDWVALHAEAAGPGRRPHRVGLPTYPFARQRCWLPDGTGRSNRHSVASEVILHPLVHRNTSGLSQIRFSSVFTGREFFLADHRVGGEPVLPGVAYLEMARAAVALAERSASGIRLSSVVWARPFVVGKAPVPLHVELSPQPDARIAYRIYSTPVGSDGDVLHGQGTATMVQVPAVDVPARLDPIALRDAITQGQPQQHRLDARQCYAAFRAMGIEYGPGHQCLEAVYFSAPAAGGSPQVLARLALPGVPDSGRAERDTAGFVLHPGLMDAAVQACIGLMAAAGQLPSDMTEPDTGPAASLPFALESFELLEQPPRSLWAWIRYARGSMPADRVQKLDIDLCGDDGRICVRMGGFSSRTPATTQPADAAGLLICSPVWVTQAAVPAALTAWSRRSILICDPDGSFLPGFEQAIASLLPGVACSRPVLSGAIEDWYAEASRSLFETIKREILRKDTGRSLIQVVVPHGGRAGLLAGLAGLVKTANRESSLVVSQVIELADSMPAGDAAAALLLDSGQHHVRHDGSGRWVQRWHETVRGGLPAGSPWRDGGVYLITGGYGGLGRMVATRIAQQTRHATLVLCGRSEALLDSPALAAMPMGDGLEIEYRQVDVSCGEQVERLVADMTRRFGRIDGIIHCAGVLRDKFIAAKSAQDFAEVFAPKLAGTLHLDHATRNAELDFFALFASGAGALGSAGQTDYAAANAFMDAFAEYRNAQVRAGERRGHTFSIDWPPWAEGGMRMEPGAAAMMRQTTGLEPLPTEAGLRIFEEILTSGAEQALVLHGAQHRIRQWLTPLQSVAASATPLEIPLPTSLGEATIDVALAGPGDPSAEPPGQDAANTTELQAAIEQMLLRAVAALMKFALRDLDVDTEWGDYGFDSITLTEFSNLLNQRYRLDLTPTLFFEYPTIAALGAWLRINHGAALADALGIRSRVLPNPRMDRPDVPPPIVAVPVAVAADRGSDHTDAVAIIGMSGRFPMARDLDAFWDSLLAGQDGITEIPADRWDWKALLGDPATEANRTNVKWGGFIDDVGHFDARFFGISPREAEAMDPQQRLLMTYVWRAIEDAGYAPGSLSGSSTGLFVGTASSGYGDLMAQSGSPIESYSSTGVVGSIGPNRMSFFLNLHGPSEPIETACSSSLVAIHRALTAMANGDCEQAIVGGINLLISPETHIAFNKAGMLSADGRCKTFSKQANGYVRGEGVGMLFLKKLQAAEQAGDHIYGVIRGSAENHGGRATTLTAPNPKAQAELIKTAYRRAGIDPRSVGYIEAHGTGTELGDPIEINGLKAAFRDLYQVTGSPDVGDAHCGIGSVKTNIGHLELAAGVAGVIKVLLQLQHRTLVRSLHCEEINPYIGLQGSPFYLVRENRAWAAPRDADGREMPRRAGVSSFGFGGVNAHVVIEEYRHATPDDDVGRALPSLVVLSAKNADRLQAYAAALLDFICADDPADASGPGADIRRLLSGRMCELAAEILAVDPREIEPAHPLDEYGFEPMHRAMLRARLEEALGVTLAEAAFRQNHCIAAMATALLDADPAIQGLLPIEPAPADAVPARGVRRDIRLADLAYTLQVGRDAMDERLALTVTSLEDLAAALQAFIDGRGEEIGNIHLGNTKDHKAVLAAFADEDLREALGRWIARGKFSRLLDLWVKGLPLDWEKLYGRSGPFPFKPRRLSAPGYPFAEQRFWIERRSAAVAQQAAVSTVLHPLVHENVSTLRQVRFSTRLTGTEFFLADHRVQGQPVLPGVAYLEMARAAAVRASGSEPNADTVVQLRDVVWIRPAILDRPRRLLIDLAPEALGAVRYEVSSEADGADRQVHSQGLVAFPTIADRPVLDPLGMLARADMQRIEVGRCYALFRDAGLEYGPAHQGIAELHVGQGQVLARLVLPVTVAHTWDLYGLHPSLMDAALQASIGLALDDAATAPDSGRLALPFAVEQIDVLGPCSATMWAWVRRSTAWPETERLRKLDIDICDEAGQVAVRIRGFSARLRDAGKSAAMPQRRSEPAHAAEGRDPVDLKARTITHLKELLSSTLRIPIEDIRSDEALDAIGVDSMMAMEMTGALEKHFGGLSKTLFFEYQTVADLADHFLGAHRPDLLRLFADAAPVVAVPPLVLASPPRPAATPRPDAAALDIAIIGLSGRYPLAVDVEQFWRNLRDGRDCITEVPADRWDWRDFYSADRSQPDRHYCKWGGFIADVDKFDPLFFNISPSAAQFIDPQERLFLEHAWMAMEDAGYRREDLQTPADDDLPGQVGVYAGVMYGEYQFLGLDSRQDGSGPSLANFYASIANRVSHALNLHGPSMAVDTMCSSSLTAIHLACQDLILGRIGLAFAGGVNVSLHPNKYNVLSQGQYISSSGRCESFGAAGNGYVPSEGVGVVLLKRLAEAERDGDHVYGVIKASALNHGGRTNGYSVPNPNAQQAVISRALRESGLDPRTIGYIEAHGTGTPLGDPIEITGLTKALGKHLPAGQDCWIGSAKSNIGHCESAAGIAGLTKVLLQMREGRIAPSLHAETLNPNIDFSATPFRVNRALREWPRPVVDGHVARRAAGLSSFGAGGSNAHLLIEEYVSPAADTRPGARVPEDSPCAVVLSARDEVQLREIAVRLQRFVRDAQAEKRQMPPLRDIAYTLQVGREAMPHRLGFSVRSLPDMVDALGRFLDGRTDGLHVGRARRGGETNPLDVAVVDSRLAELVARWVEGAAVDWRLLYANADNPPGRVSLPTYPFARDRCWVALPETSHRAEAAGREADPDVLILEPAWVEQALRPATKPTDYAEHRVLFSGPLTVPDMPVCIPLRAAGAAIDASFIDRAVQVFEQIKDILQRQPSRPVLLQVVLGDDEPGHLSSALAAMLRTARMENPLLVGQLIQLDAGGARLSAAELGVLLRDNGEAPAHVRYRGGRREAMTWAEPDRASFVPWQAWRQRGVYLITGGAGGLGLIFARHIVQQVADVTLILTGRSELDPEREAAIAALRAAGARVDYRRVDVCDGAAVQALIRDIDGAYGGQLHGVIHAAGIIRDGFILNKTPAQVRDVLAPKVSGVVNLDLATRSRDLDFFVVFSSVAGAAGNPGQSDYAAGNAFLDAYAAHCNALAAGNGGPQRRMLSINWPLWEHGGMTIDAAAREAMGRATGLTPLRTEAGLRAFHQVLRSGAAQAMVLQGETSRVRALFLEPPDAEAGSSEPLAYPGDDAHSEALTAGTRNLVLTMVSDLLQIPATRIETDVVLEQYGIDSVAALRLTSDLDKILGPVPRTLFYEHPTVEAVADWLVGAFAAKLTALLRIAPAGPRVTEADEVVRPAIAQPHPTTPPAATVAADESIAVIGMAGRFPKAKDLEEFWDNLTQGRDCITEVPAERWDHSRYFDPEKGAPGKTYCKWGGFLDDVDRFDAAFFRISPAEAELLDPQERLFLETVWTLLETSGYLGEALQRLCQSRVGVFVGSMSQQYHALRSDLARESLVVLSSQGSIANRVSYVFDFQGPSVAVDTMCSSALNAVHMACESLLRGDCRIAIAGGVNLTIHPKKYIGLSASQMIGSHPDSTSFGDGDGYLPAEAVGAVLLKPLREAERDGDTILAVIQSTAVNHGGRSNGYMVPNGSVQADLIARNFARAGIDPRTVTYVEAAANGSPLADAIEVNALSSVFRTGVAEAPVCAIGSVKSTIGHAEAASGIAQLIKVILQLRHGKLVPTIKAQPLNPDIDFAGTPFRLQRTLTDWRQPRLVLDGGPPRDYPRRATVSSFGAGGSNAHLIIEEYAQPSVPAGSLDAPQLILLSARTAVQREALARKMLVFLEQRPDVSMADLAYTLQTAREAFDHRLALVAEGSDRMIDALRAWLAGETTGAAAAIITGDGGQDDGGIRQLLTGKTGQSTLQMLLAEKDLAKLALYWAKGARIRWEPMHAGTRPRRVALPTYPFDRQSYWLTDTSEPGIAPQAADPVEGFVIDPKRTREGNIQCYITQTLARLLRIAPDRVDHSSGLLDHGADSMVSTRLRRGFQEIFGVRISARDVLSCANLAALADLVGARQASTTSPLSEGQTGLWLLQQRYPGMSAYNVPLALRCAGVLDIALLRQACAHMLERFPVLGTVFGRNDEVLHQRLPDDPRFDFEHRRTGAMTEAAVTDLLRAASKQPFDLQRGKLFRVVAVSPEYDRQTYVLIVVHHIVFDGRSALLLAEALIATYRALLAGRTLPPRPTQQAGYADFVAWQQRFLQSDRAAAQIAYWRAQLSGDLPVLSLPCDHPRPARPNFDGASVETMLPARTADAIKTLAASLGVNPSILFLGAFSLLLHRLSGDDDLLIGMPTAGRPESRFDAVVGYFVNMVCIRSRISRRQNAAGFLRDLQLTVADALDHSDYPFPALLNALDIARDRAASPLFQTVFAYQNFVQPGDLSDQDGVLSDTPAIEILTGVNQEGSHDLALEVYHGNSTVRLRFDYDTALFTGETISRAMSGYVRLLEAILSRPDAAIADLPLLSAEERRQIVTEWNADAAAHDASVPVIASFERQARLVPEQIALQGEHGSLSYRALDRQSSALARGLLAAGVVQGDAVGVCMKDRQKMIVAMLGIWKVAAIYVPIGTDQPAVRLRHLLDDSRVRLLVTDPAARDRIAEQYSDGGPTCLVPDDLPQALSGSSPDLSPRIDPDNAAYVIYTSGSTGQPKGVVIPHRAIAHHCRVVSAYYQLTPQDRILQFAPLSVDASLEQILPGLLYGATVIVRPERLWTAHEFRQAIVGLGLTVIDVPPSYLHELLLDIGDDAADLGSLRLAVTGGETLRPETVALWRAGPFASRRLVNAYGPTETTITSTVFEAGAFDPASCATVPIGRPLPGESAYILDRHGEPVPFGVAGELHIGGAGLALGYLGRPELTREAFLDNPVAPGSLVYKTGDRARWLADGSIALLGRVDDQVKVRGFRVACGEVEAALRRLDPVQDAAVLCRTVNASEQLVAFVVYGAGVQPPAVTELKQALAGVLPEYMIPAAIVALASLPMTASGKVDRASLMQRDLAAPQATGDTAPRNETEARLGQIWREVLQRPHVGIHDSFFDLGGHSLLALRLMALIQQRFGRDLPLSALFEAPDIARQARLLGGETPDWSPLVCLTAPEGEKAPFFCVHAVAGTVLCYQQLALLIGQGRPVYALQAPDPIVGAHPGTVDGLAERYVAAIRGVRPHGPYHLGGWSMGGVIAYEMAQQLHAAGEPVARLALIDSYRPDVVLGIEKALGAVSQPPDAGGGVLLNANRRAMDSYQPRPYPNGAAVFTAEAVTIDPGWSACVGGKLITGSLPGDHDSLLQPPHVHVLADRLARYLDNGI